MFSKFSEANGMAVTISVITIIILYLNNEWLKVKLSKVCVLPVPIELIAVVSGTLVSRYFDLSRNYNIDTIGFIPTGFPGVNFHLDNEKLPKI